MKSAINWISMSAVVLLLALSVGFAWLWHGDNHLANNNDIFGPKMFWQNQQHLMGHLFVISAILTAIVAVIVVVRFTKSH